jgi:hypothetical protein
MKLHLKLTPLIPVSQLSLWLGWLFHDGLHMKQMDGG